MKRTKTTRTWMRRKRTSPGSKLASPGRMRGLVSSSVLLAWSLPAALVAAPGEKKPKAPAPYALIAGAVFRDTGLSLPGAQVTLLAESGSGQARKPKKINVVTDSRGEFAVRVPAAPMRYTLQVRAAGYQNQEKSVSVSGEDRVDVFFRLEPASK